jgi:hypothetical protein
MDWYIFQTSGTNVNLRHQMFQKIEDMQYTVATEAWRLLWLV